MKSLYHLLLSGSFLLGCGTVGTQRGNGAKTRLAQIENKIIRDTRLDDRPSNVYPIAQPVQTGDPHRDYRLNAQDSLRLDHAAAPGPGWTGTRYDLGLAARHAKEQKKERVLIFHAQPNSADTAWYAMTCRDIDGVLSRWTQIVPVAEIQSAVFLYADSDDNAMAIADLTPAESLAGKTYRDVELTSFPATLSQLSEDDIATMGYHEWGHVMLNKNPATLSLIKNRPGIGAAQEEEFWCDRFMALIAGKKRAYTAMTNYYLGFKKDCIRSNDTAAIRWSESYPAQYEWFHNPTAFHTLRSLLELKDDYSRPHGMGDLQRMKVKKGDDRFFVMPK